MSEKFIVEVPDGEFSCYIARPDTQGPFPVIVILQEIFGVNEGIRSIADDYAKKGYIAVAPDLFWRAEPGLSLSDAMEEDWKKGFALYTAYDLDLGIKDIAATISAARKLQDANGKVGVTGYCLGGLLTYLSAARTDADAFVAYYGGATERYLDEAKNIKAPLLYHLAEEDEYIDKAAQSNIKAALAPVASTRVYSYPDRNHAFARPDGIHFDAVDAKLANVRTELFFADQLKSI